VTNGTALQFQDFFSADPEENVGTSKNPGLMYTAAGTTMLLPNAIVGLYKYFVYRRRTRLQAGIYNQKQLGLLKQLQESDVDLSRLRDEITKEFIP
jgi:hypothetical protein